MKNASIVKVIVTVNRPVKDVWPLWTDPMHVIKWNAASDDWQTTYATNDLRVGGKFTSRMEAKDGSMGFDFEGIYTRVDKYAALEYKMEDGRVVKVIFNDENNKTTIIEEFDAESENPVEMQRAGWQAILDNFKRHAEAKNPLEVLRFDILINASTQVVYEKMLGEKTYKQWTTVFNPDSQVEGKWDKGATVRFVGEDENGRRGGVVSRIRENMPNKFVCIEHLGIIEGTEEIMTGPKVAGWQGAMESYSFTAQGSKTLVEASLDSNQEFKSYWLETWPKALSALKKICES